MGAYEVEDRAEGFAVQFEQLFGLHVRLAVKADVFKGKGTGDIASVHKITSCRE